MNKLLTIALMLLIELTANAQGTWSTGIREADELKGDNGGPYYRYEVKGDGGLVLWDWDDWEFKIFTTKGGFDVWYYEKSGFRYIRITMGLYTLDGKLTDKRDIELAADHTHKEAWINKKGMYYPATRKMIKKMLKALKSGDGYVRIICAREGTTDFDLKITPYKEEAE
jgi:hypothetical protein